MRELKCPIIMSGRTPLLTDLTVLYLELSKDKPMNNMI